MTFDSTVTLDEPSVDVGSAELVLYGRRAATGNGRPLLPVGTTVAAISAELAVRRPEIIERAILIAETEIAAVVPPVTPAVPSDVLAAAIVRRVENLLSALGGDDISAAPRDDSVVLLRLPGQGAELPAAMAAVVQRSSRAAVLFHAAAAASDLPGARAAADAMAIVAERLASGEEEPEADEDDAVGTQRRRAATLRAIIDHNAGPDDAATRAAAAIGCDLAIPRGIVAFTAAASARAGESMDRRIESAVWRFQDRVADALLLPLRLDDIPQAAFLLPASGSGWGHGVDLAEQLAGTYHLCVVVVEPSTGIAGLRNCERTATILVTLAHHRGAEAGAVREHDHLLDILLCTAAAEASDAFVQRVLGPVLRLTPSRAEPLLDTLGALLAARGGFAAAAQRLRVHRETVKYRMGRLSELTGYSLADPGQRTHLDVALRLSRLSKR